MNDDEEWVQLRFNNNQSQPNSSHPTAAAAFDDLHDDSSIEEDLSGFDDPNDLSSATPMEDQFLTVGRTSKKGQHHQKGRGVYTTKEGEEGDRNTMTPGVDDGSSPQKQSDTTTTKRSEGTYLQPWERKQQQRRIGESWLSNFAKTPSQIRQLRNQQRQEQHHKQKEDQQPTPTKGKQGGKSTIELAAESGQNIDVRRVMTRYGPGPDRGRLIHKLDMQSGYAVNPRASLQKKGAGTITRTLPPIAKTPPPTSQLELMHQVNVTISSKSTSKLHDASFDARLRGEAAARNMGFFNAPEFSEIHRDDLHLDDGDLHSVSSFSGIEHRKDTVPIAPSLGFVGGGDMDKHQPPPQQSSLGSSQQNLGGALERFGSGLGQSSFQQGSSTFLGQSFGSATMHSQAPHLLSAENSELHPTSGDLFSDDAEETTSRPLSRSLQKAMPHLTTVALPPIQTPASGVSSMKASPMPEEQEHTGRVEDMQQSLTKKPSTLLAHRGKTSQELSAETFVPSARSDGSTQTTTSQSDPLSGGASASITTASGSVVKSLTNLGSVFAAQYAKDTASTSKNESTSNMTAAASTATAKKSGGETPPNGDPAADHDELWGLRKDRHPNTNAQQSGIDDEDDDEAYLKARRLQHRKSTRGHIIPVQNPSNTPTFGAVEHLLEAACPSADTKTKHISDETGGVTHDVSLHLPKAKASLKPQMFALIVAFDGQGQGHSTIEFSSSTVSATAMASMLTHHGYQVTTLFNNDAIVSRIKDTIDDIFAQAAALQREGNAARVVLYFTGRAIRFGEDELPYFICHDELPVLYSRTQKCTMSICPELLATREILSKEEKEQLQRLHGRRSSLAVANAGGESTFRWEMPVVIADLKMVRMGFETISAMALLEKKIANKQRRKSKPVVVNDGNSSGSSHPQQVAAPLVSNASFSASGMQPAVGGGSTTPTNMSHSGITFPSLVGEGGGKNSNSPQVSPTSNSDRKSNHQRDLDEMESSAIVPLMSVSHNTSPMAKPGQTSVTSGLMSGSIASGSLRQAQPETATTPESKTGGALDDDVESLGSSMSLSLRGALRTNISLLGADFVDDLQQGAVSYILSHRFPHGNLKVKMASRHAGSLTYFFLRALEGSCHPTLWAINSFIVDRLQRRHIPTLDIEFDTVEDGQLAVRSSDHLYPKDRVILPSLVHKSMQRTERLKKACRFQLWCEVDIRYNSNPFAFTTLLKKRLEHVIGTNHQLEQQQQPSTYSSNIGAEEAETINVYAAKSRGVARFYFPIDVQHTKDTVQQELRHLLFSIKDHDTHRLENAKVSLMASSVYWCHGDNCAVITMTNSSAAGKRRDEISFHGDGSSETWLEYFVHKNVFRHSEMLSQARLMECITLAGQGTHCHVGKFFKHIRLGTVNVKSCFNCTVERLAVNNLGENLEEEKAAVFVQKMVRSYLTKRVMRSRLAAACTYVRDVQDCAERLFSAWMGPMLQWFYDYQEESFIALEVTADRVRLDTIQEQLRERHRIYNQVSVEWLETETKERQRLEIEEITEVQLLLRTTDYHLEHRQMSNFLQAVADEFFISRDEKMQRHAIIAQQYGGRMTLKQQMKEDRVKVGEQEAAWLASHEAMQGKLSKRKSVFFGARATRSFSVSTDMPQHKEHQHHRRSVKRGSSIHGLHEDGGSVVESTLTPSRRSSRAGSRRTSLALGATLTTATNTTSTMTPMILDVADSSVTSTTFHLEETEHHPHRKRSHHNPRRSSIATTVSNSITASLRDPEVVYSVDDDEGDSAQRRRRKSTKKGST